MGKSKKMAVRKYSKKPSGFEFSMPAINLEIFRPLVMIALLSALGFMGYEGFKLWKNIWPVKQVLLQGETKYVHAADIVNFVNQQPVKGMLAIDLQQLQKGASQIDWVQAVEVRKVWPEQLIFVVTEHQPVAKVNGIILTREGTLIQSTEDNGLFNDLPVISIPAQKVLSEKNADESSLTVAQLMEIWQEYKQLKRQLELVDLDSSGLLIDAIGNWHIEFNESLEMNLGRKNRMERVARLVKVYQVIADKDRIKSIDLRYNNGVSVEWVNQQEQELKS